MSQAAKIDHFCAQTAMQRVQRRLSHFAGGGRVGGSIPMLKAEIDTSMRLHTVKEGAAQSEFCPSTKLEVAGELTKASE